MIKTEVDFDCDCNIKDLIPNIHLLQFSGNASAKHRLQCKQISYWQNKTSNGKAPGTCNKNMTIVKTNQSNSA